MTREQRPLQFRAYCYTMKQWVPFLIDPRGLIYNLPQSDCDIVAEQFTGMFDKNNQEIFEGDILQGNGRTYRCIYKDGIFYGISYANTYWIYPIHDLTECEVIGNIHETPELHHATT